MSTLLSVENMSFGYENGSALFSNLSFKVEEGEFVSLLGCNGSGKSTLLKLIAKRLDPHCGLVRILSQNITSLNAKEYACIVGYLEQSPEKSERTLQEYVLMGALPRFTSHRFWFSSSEKKKALDLLSEVGIVHLAQRPLSQVSGGERQLTQICRALMSDPALLLLDEPVSHLDIHHVEMVIRLLKQVQRERGVTVLTTLHDINLAYTCSDRVIVLDEFGSIQQLDLDGGKLETLQSVFKSEFEFLTYPEGSALIPRWKF